MLDALKNWVANIIAVVFFITLIEILLPESKTKKYVGFVTGTLVIIMIMMPVVKAFGGDIKFDIPELNNLSSNEGTSIENQSQRLSNTQSRQIMKVYREKLQDSIKKQLRDVKGIECTEVICKVWEQDNGKLGEIKELEISVKDKTEKIKEKGIKQIEVNINMKKSLKSKERAEVSGEIRNQIIERIVSTYRVDSSKIKIIYLKE